MKITEAPAIGWPRASVTLTARACANGLRATVCWLSPLIAATSAAGPGVTSTCQPVAYETPDGPELIITRSTSLGRLFETVSPAVRSGAVIVPSAPTVNFTLVWPFGHVAPDAGSSDELISPRRREVPVAVLVGPVALQRDRELRADRGGLLVALRLNKTRPQGPRWR